MNGKYAFYDDDDDDDKSYAPNLHTAINVVSIYYANLTDKTI